MSTAPSGAPVLRSFGEVARAMNTTSTGPAGGFLLDSELAAGVWDKARSTDGPLSRCLVLTTTKSEFDFPAFDESSRVAGSRWGGIRFHWEGDDDASLTAFASQPAVEQNTFRPERIVIYTTPFSNDLLDDSSLIEGALDYVACQSIRFGLVDSMINGTGVKRPLGVINAPSTISVTRGGAGTIASGDIDAMWSRLWGYCRRNAVWMCSDDTLLKVDQAATTAGWPPNQYMPQGYGGNPFPLLKGRPLLPVEQCPVLGAVGDLIVGDWSQYAMVFRSMTGTIAPEFSLSYDPLDSLIERRSSGHLLFDTDQTVFRFKARVDGMPLWRQPVTVADGSQTAGPFVILK